MDRTAQLDTLIGHLKELIIILEKDKRCQWHNHFTNALAYAEELKSTSFTQDDLHKLSSSIRHVYGGMGSFNDYAPLEYSADGKTWKAIPGMEKLEEASNSVYESSTKIIIIGSY